MHTADGPCKRLPCRSYTLQLFECLFGCERSFLFTDTFLEHSGHKNVFESSRLLQKRSSESTPRANMNREGVNMIFAPSNVAIENLTSPIPQRNRCPLCTCYYRHASCILPIASSIVLRIHVHNNTRMQKIQGLGSWCAVAGAIPLHCARGYQHQGVYEPRLPVGQSCRHWQAPPLAEVLTTYTHDTFIHLPTRIHVNFGVSIARQIHGTFAETEFLEIIFDIIEADRFLAMLNHDSELLLARF